MDQSELSQLVDLAQSGDQGAIERLLAHFEPSMQRLAGKVCPPADAEDAVQEVLMRVSSQVGMLRVSAAFVGWSMKMLVRECLRLKRQAVRWVYTIEEEVTAPHINERDLVRAMGAISSTSREILLQREVLGYSAQEAALRLSITLESAKSRLRRARTELREEYLGARAGAPRR
jgi:RNA polymerase sigma factor (sigma-70 family)